MYTTQKLQNSAESQDASPNEGRQRVKDGSGSRSILLLSMTSEPTNHRFVGPKKNVAKLVYKDLYRPRKRLLFFSIHR